MNTNDDTKSKMNNIINNLNANNAKIKENGPAPVKRATDRHRVEPGEPRSGIHSAFISRPGTHRTESNEFAVIGEYKIRVANIEVSRKVETGTQSDGIYFYMAGGSTVAFLVGGSEYDDALALYDAIDSQDMNQ